MVIPAEGPSFGVAPSGTWICTVHSSKTAGFISNCDEWNVHIHVPEGATPKDGPSAGITMLTALTSAFTQRKVKDQLAMTGEITLRGRVLPVGGIQEKMLAAKRNDVTDVILSVENKRDFSEIKEDYVKGLNFHFVTSMMEVLDLALEKEQDVNDLDYNQYLMNSHKRVAGFLSQQDLRNEELGMRN